jgi:hypothetical protein
VLTSEAQVVEIAFSGERSISLARIASAQGQVIWPSIDHPYMVSDRSDCKASFHALAMCKIEQRIDRAVFVTGGTAWREVCNIELRTVP